MLVIRNLDYFFSNREKGNYNSLDNLTLDKFQFVGTYFVFTVKELSNTYFNSCSALTTFFNDNIDLAEHDKTTNSLFFPDDTVKFTFCGQFPCKNDDTRTFNKFEITVE